MSAIREFLKYGMYGKSRWYIAYCPLYGRCPLFGVSAKRGSTVDHEIFLHTPFNENVVHIRLLPLTVRISEASDGFGLLTEHLYSPPVVLFSLCMYLAVGLSIKTVSVPSVTSSVFLVQDTVVAGPPVEIQVRVN